MCDVRNKRDVRDVVSTDIPNYQSPRSGMHMQHQKEGSDCLYKVLPTPGVGSPEGPYVVVNYQ